MPEYSATVTTGAGSATLPVSSLYGAAATWVRLKQLWIFNTAATAVTLRLVRVTTAGTSTAVTSTPYDTGPGIAAIGTARNTHTVAPTVTAGDLATIVIPAAIGGGVILPFEGNDGLAIPGNTANAGLALLPTAAGPVLAVTWVWTE